LQLERNHGELLRLQRYHSGRDNFSHTRYFKIINRVVFYSHSDEAQSSFFELNEPPVTYFSWFEGSDCLTDSVNRMTRDLTCKSCDTQILSRSSTVIVSRAGVSIKKLRCTAQSETRTKSAGRTILTVGTFTTPLKSRLQSTRTKTGHRPQRTLAR